VLTNLAMGAVWSTLPAGVVNVLTGDVLGGQRLAAHPDVHAISFTGSAAVAATLVQAGKPLDASVGRCRCTPSCAGMQIWIGPSQQSPGRDRGDGGRRPACRAVASDVDAAIRSGLRRALARICGPVGGR
jgi:hypothetical protein